jgi:hypothetical protein
VPKVLAIMLPPIQIVWLLPFAKTSEDVTIISAMPITRIRKKTSMPFGTLVFAFD